MHGKAKAVSFKTTLLAVFSPLHTTLHGEFAAAAPPPLLARNDNIGIPPSTKATNNLQQYPVLTNVNMNTVRDLKRDSVSSTTSTAANVDAASSISLGSKHSRDSSNATSSTGTAPTGTLTTSNGGDGGEYLSKSWEVPDIVYSAQEGGPWSQSWDGADEEDSTFTGQTVVIEQAPKEKKKKRYPDGLVWPCRATQLVPDMSNLFEGEVVFYDGEFFHAKLRCLVTGVTFFKQILGRGAVIDSAGRKVYDVYPAYPSEGKFTKHYEILEKRFPPDRYSVELPDTWFENGAQPASEVEANLKMIFRNRPVVMHDHRGDTTAFLYETADSVFHDNGATIVDMQALLAGRVPGANSYDRPSLADCCTILLGENPQDDGNHDPVKDAGATRKLWMLLNPDYDRAAEEAKVRATGWTPPVYPVQIPFNERPEQRGGRRRGGANEGASRGGRGGRRGRGKGGEVRRGESSKSNGKHTSNYVSETSTRDNGIYSTPRGNSSMSGHRGQRGGTARGRGRGYGAAPSGFKLDDGDFPALGLK